MSKLLRLCDLNPTFDERPGESLSVLGVVEKQTDMGMKD